MGNSNSSHSSEKRRQRLDGPESMLSAAEQGWLRALIRQLDVLNVADCVQLLAIADHPQARSPLYTVLYDLAIHEALNNVPPPSDKVEDHIVAQVCHVLANVDSHFASFPPQQQQLALCALWFPLARTLAGVYVPAPPPPPELPPIALRAKTAPTTTSPASEQTVPTQITFAPTHCAPSRTIQSTSLPPSPPPGTSLRTLLSLYWLRPYLLTTPTPLPSSTLLADRRSGLLLPHLGGQLTRPILQPQHILQLSNALPPPLRTCWRQAYASARDGRAWSALHRGVMQTVVQALASWAVVLVIRDTQGQVFGGVINEAPLIPGPKFRAGRAAVVGAGGAAAVAPPAEVAGLDLVPFVFSIHKGEAAVNMYRPAGINANQLYLNSGSSTLPNGIGFGGQLDFFGLWLDASMDTGHSRVAGETSLTFGNPVLASDKEFNVADIEAWVVECAGWERDPDAEVVPGGGDGKKSVLDQFPELVEMLEMGGRKMYSKELPQVPVDWDEME